MELMAESRTDKSLDEFRGEVAHRFDLVDAQFKVVEQKFDAVDQRFKAVDQRFDAVDQRFDAVDKRFDRVEGRFDSMNRTLIGAAIAIIVALIGVDKF